MHPALYGWGQMAGFLKTNNPEEGFIKYADPLSKIDIVGINSIQQDKEGKIWLNCTLGIVRIDPVNDQIAGYGSNYGVDGNNLLERAGYKGRDGKIYFGDQHGYYVFSPNQFVTNNTAPRIALSGLKIRGKSVLPGDKVIKTASIEDTKEISLRYNENAFSLDYAGIHYSDPENNRHLYRLENYEDAWHEAGRDKTAYYYNVPPGRYIFHIKVANSDGLWAEKNNISHYIPSLVENMVGLHCLRSIGGCSCICCSSLPESKNNKSRKRKNKGKGTGAGKRNRKSLS
jgi:hypothetical protein